MAAEGYAILGTEEDFQGFDPTQADRVLGLFAEEGMPRAPNRGPTLRAMTEKALTLLDRAPQGFFLLVEGAQIDWRGHENDLQGVIDEVLDFSDAVEAVFAYADRRAGTLVVVTADHETGGLAIHGGNVTARTVEARWTTAGHTASMVPLFAHGTGAGAFGGVLDNTEIGVRLIAMIRDGPAPPQAAPKVGAGSAGGE